MSVIDDDFNNAFTSTDDFAVSAAFKLTAASGAVSIKGNFFKEGVSYPGENAEMETTDPVIQCLTSDVEGADHDSTLVIDSVTYYVRSNKPDGLGMSILELCETQITE